MPPRRLFIPPAACFRLPSAKIALVRAINGLVRLSACRGCLRDGPSHARHMLLARNKKLPSGSRTCGYEVDSSHCRISGGV